MQQMAQESVRCYSWNKLMWNGNCVGNFILPGSSYCDLVFMDKICLCDRNAQPIIEVYGDGIMRVWHIRM